MADLSRGGLMVRGLPAAACTRICPTIPHASAARKQQIRHPTFYQGCFVSTGRQHSCKMVYSDSGAASEQTLSCSCRLIAGLGAPPPLPEGTTRQLHEVTPTQNTWSPLFSPRPLPRLQTLSFRSAAQNGLAVHRLKQKNSTPFERVRTAESAGACSGRRGFLEIFSSRNFR